jgi:hypothetical protein
MSTQGRQKQGEKHTETRPKPARGEARTSSIMHLKCVLTTRTSSTKIQYQSQWLFYGVILNFCGFFFGLAALGSCYTDVKYYVVIYVPCYCGVVLKISCYTHIFMFFVTVIFVFFLILTLTCYTTNICSSQRKYFG